MYSTTQCQQVSLSPSLSMHVIITCDLKMFALPMCISLRTSAEGLHFHYLCAQANAIMFGFVLLQPENIMIYHQLRQDEVDTILAYLESLAQFSAALVGLGLSAGQLLVANPTCSGRGSGYIRQRAVAPFLIQ